MQVLMASGDPFLFLRRSFVRMGQKAGTLDPIRVRTKQAFIHGETMVVILCHLPQPHGFVRIKLGDLVLILFRIVGFQIEHRAGVPTTR